MWYDIFKKVRGRKAMEILTYQTAVFFQNKQDNSDELWFELKKKFGEIIDKMPVIVPLPENVPEELPIVSFTSSNGIFTINISRTRADFIINLEGKAPLGEDYVCQISKKFAQNVSELTKVKRTGIVGRFLIIDEHGVEALNRNYFNDKFNNAVELSIRVNNRDAFEGFSLNNITDIQTVQGEKDGKSINGIIVLRDINNVDKHMVMSSEKIGKLVDHAFGCFKESSIKEWV